VASPQQVKDEYVQHTVEALQNEQIRVSIDDRHEKLGNKICETQMKKHFIF